MTNVQRTYGSSNRNRPTFTPSSPPSSLSSSSPPQESRKRSFEDTFSLSNKPPFAKRLKVSSIKPENKSKQGPKQKTLTQLHLCFNQTIIKTCALCGLSYTKGVQEDEVLHKKHCMRMQKGTEWGKEEEKEGMKAGVQEIVSGLKLKSGKKGRIICVNASVKGKVGSKLTTLLETVNFALSSSPLPPPILNNSKAYLFLLPTPIPTKEKIVGCVIAQSIKTAMAIVPSCSDSSSESSPIPNTSTPKTVDESTSVSCNPTPLPTPLGIPRIFVTSMHRRQGIASALLSAAASTFIHGCVLDPGRGQVAFSQTTGDGVNLMRKWGCTRMYDEDTVELDAEKSCD